MRHQTIPTDDEYLNAFHRERAERLRRREASRQSIHYSHEFAKAQSDRMNGIDWYDSHARFYDQLIGRTPTMDPMAEKYYSISPYSWCANNPIRYSDYNGLEIHINNDEELRLIQNIVSKEEQRFISMTPRGNIERKLLSKGFSDLPCVSKNFEILSSLVQDDAIVELSLSTQKTARLENGSFADPDNIPFPFNDIIPPDEFDNDYSLQGAIGWTLAPLSHQWTRNDAIIRNERPPEYRFISTTENYQIQINAYGLKQESTYLQLVETVAHELLGHAYLMIFGFDSLHGSSKSVNDFIIDRSNEAIRHFNYGN